MRPPLLGWLYVAYGLLATVALLVASCESFAYHRARRALESERGRLVQDIDSAITRLGRGLPVKAPDGRYLWRMDTTAARRAIVDTVRRPTR